jgi:hypothetical protein
MEPTSVLLGVLLASTKGLALVAVGFGIAWWRSRVRIRELEAAQPAARELDERLARVESSLDYITSTLERLGSSQDDLRRRLPGASGSGSS